MRHKTVLSDVFGRLILCGLSASAVVSGCGDIDPNAYIAQRESMEDALPGDDSDGSSLGTAADEGTDTTFWEDACTSIEWGLGCRTNAPTYNITFDGLNVAEKTDETVSLESLYCAGYESVVIVMGDAQCVACPSWYRAIGAIADDIHARNGVIVSACTDNLGLDTLSNDAALSVTEDINPDYVVGDSPFKYPCRYEFTPYTTVIDLSDAMILGKDSTAYQLSTQDILSLLDTALED